MSNLIKKFSVAALVAVSFAVAGIASAQTTSTTTTTSSTVSTSNYVFTRNLTVGSRGADVSVLQQILINGGYLQIAAPTDYFGNLTKAAVARWQAAAGISPAVGFFGPISRARLNASLAVSYPAGCSSNSGFSQTTGASCATTTTTTTTTSTSYPAGCTSNSGYSSTTGGSCAARSYPAGCTSSAGYSPTTGVKCDSAMAPLPAGCTSNAGYSPTTGQSCAATTTTTSTTTTTTTTTNNNGAGAVDEYDLLSTPADNREVGEGEDDVKVIGIAVTADDGSDLNFTAIRVEFCNDETPATQCNSAADADTDANNDFDEYASDVSIWMGNKEVARVDSSVFTSDNDFSKTITLNGAMVDSGDTENFYVAVSGASNLDSTDIGDTDNWSVDVTSFRFVDAQAAVISEDPDTDSRTFTFETFATSSDLELKLTEASNNPDAQVVEVDETDSTDGAVLLSGNLKAIGSDIEVKQMTIRVTATNTTPADDASTTASEFILEIDGVEVDSVASNDCETAIDCDGVNDGAAVAVYVFNDVDFMLDENDTVTVRVLANVNGTDEFSEGDSLVATMDNDDTDAEDQNGDDLSDADKSGTLAGEAQSFTANGIRVTVGTRTTEITENDGAVNDNATFTWGITVSAFGDDDVYINADAADVVATLVADGGDCTGATGNDAADVDTIYEIETSSGVMASCSGVITDTSDATEVPADAGAYGAAYATENFYRIVAGTSETFTITVTSLNSLTSKLVHAFLTNIEWTTDEVDSTTNDGLVADINDYTFDLENASATPYKTVN